MGKLETDFSVFRMFWGRVVLLILEGLKKDERLDFMFFIFMGSYIN